MLTVICLSGVSPIAALSPCRPQGTVAVLWERSRGFTPTQGLYHEVTCGVPGGSAPTYKRVSAVCTKARGATTEEGACDKLHDWIAGYANEPGKGRFGGVDEGWRLLDPKGSGDCLRWAGCMAYAVKMIGIPDASPERVVATQEACPSNRLWPPEWRLHLLTWPPHYDWLFFDSGGAWGINPFEGCCRAKVKSGATSKCIYYAICPVIKADNPFGIVQTLLQDGVLQKWCRENWDICDPTPVIPVVPSNGCDPFECL